MRGIMKRWGWRRYSWMKEDLFSLFVFAIPVQVYSNWENFPLFLSTSNLILILSPSSSFLSPSSSFLSPSSSFPFHPHSFFFRLHHFPNDSSTDHFNLYQRSDFHSIISITNRRSIKVSKKCYHQQFEPWSLSSFPAWHPSFPLNTRIHTIHIHHTIHHPMVRTIRTMVDGRMYNGQIPTFIPALFHQPKNCLDLMLGSDWNIFTFQTILLINCFRSRSELPLMVNLICRKLVY